MDDMGLPMSVPIRPMVNALGIRRYPGDHVYIVRWPDTTTKVGTSARRARWVGFQRYGGVLYGLLSSTDYNIEGLEERLQSEMATFGPPAFRSKAEADRHLNEGAGYLECNRLTDEAFGAFCARVRIIANELRRSN